MTLSEKDFVIVIAVTVGNQNPQVELLLSQLLGGGILEALIGLQSEQQNIYSYNTEYYYILSYIVFPKMELAILFPYYSK